MSEEPTVISLLADQVRSLERNVNLRFDAQDQTLREIKAQTTATNGRVSVLERARERTQGAVSAYRWVPLVFGGAVSAGFTLLVLALTGGIHG